MVGGASRVTKFDLKGEGVTGIGGSLPTSIGKLDALTTINLGYCGLVGTIPSSLGSLTRLTMLGLQGNALSGPVPASFCSLGAYISLWLDFNPGLACHPSCLASFTSLIKDAGLPECPSPAPTPAPSSAPSSKPSSIPTSAPTTPAAELAAGLRRKQAQRRALPALAAASTVSSAVVGGLGLASLLYAAVARPPLLVPAPSSPPSAEPSMGSRSETSDGDILCGYWSTLTPASKGKLTNWCGPKTETGTYANGPCSGAGKGAWLGVKCASAVADGPSRVTVLDTCLSTSGSSCAVTGLGGVLPSNIGLLDALTSIDMGYNGIGGSLPSSIGLLTALTSLRLGSNRLAKTVPSELGQLKKLALLRLSKNWFTGTLPSALCSLPAAVSLQLQSLPLLTCYPACLSEGYSALQKDAALALCPVGSS